MTNTQKSQIKTVLKQYCDRYASQNAAANSLKNVSSATISQLLNDKWELINEKMWRNIAAQIGINDTSWLSVATTNHLEITETLDFARAQSETIAMIGPAGSGKSNTCREYARSTPSAVYLQCDDYWNRKQFLGEMLKSMGKDNTGYNIAEMVEAIVSNLITMEKPLLILDEADKLNENLLYFIITLYNKLQDNCGMVLIATDFLKKRLERGKKLNKKGYKEIYSRIGNQFIEIDTPCSACIRAICTSNGITDSLAVTQIINRADGDLRRVKRLVQAAKADVSLLGN